MLSFDMTTLIDLIVMDHAKDLYLDARMKEAKLPAPATPGSGAIDLLAAEDAAIKPGDCVQVKTGLRMHMRDPNIAGMVLPRSGLGAKNGLVLGNLVGFIDNDYQGEILCFMWNRNTDGPIIHVIRGMKFAQMAFVPVYTPKFNLVEQFETQTVRGEGGFGSTGS